jgi:retinol-binding protein 3
MKALVSPVSLFATWLLFLSWSPAVAQKPVADPSITPEERSAVIDGIATKLNEIYVFAETARKMSDSLRERAQEYNSITNAKDLAKKLTADLREVSRDRHLGVMFFPEGAREFSPDKMSPEEKKTHREFLEKINFGFEKAERMSGNIGYLDIRGFVPVDLGAETAAAAMSFVANTDALIVDLRKNRGGEPEMIAYVLSYLFDQPTHLNDLYQRQGDKTQQWWTKPHVPGLRLGGKKPVYVLTSKDTFSGGEEFAYDVKNLKRATLLGETTKGGAHDSRPVKVSDRFMVEMPFARAINPITRTNWEGTGVAPDIAKPADESLDAAYWMAVDKLIETTSNARQKEDLQRLKAKGKRN